MNSKLMYLLTSRKFWAAVVAIVVILLEMFYSKFPFTEDQIFSFVTVIVAYILGTAIEDAGRSLATRGK